MSTVCKLLGIARSHVHERLTRPAAWQDGRSLRDPIGDEMLAQEVKEQIADLPTYGYRRACALVNRHRRAAKRPVVNHKRLFRVMKQAGLLLPKAPKRKVSSRPHDGRVAVDESDRRWCSDGFEIRCDSGEIVTNAFVEDCCDREIMAWRAWPGRGLPGDPVREMLIEAVEKRFGAIEAVPDGHRLEFLSDNGGAYIAHDTKSVARALGLAPIRTPVCSPQSNGIAESFVNTFKRDYVSRMDCKDARTVMRQLAQAFEHYNEVHPHSALKMKSPREFRRGQLERRRPVQAETPALFSE